MFCTYTRPRYQVSVYRTIGPLVYIVMHSYMLCNMKLYTPQPLYNTIAGVQANFRVSYTYHVITVGHRVITRVKCIVTSESQF